MSARTGTIVVLCCDRDLNVVFSVLDFISCFFSQIARLCVRVGVCAPQWVAQLLGRPPSSHPVTACINDSVPVTGSRNTFELTGNEWLNRPKLALQT